MTFLVDLYVMGDAFIENRWSHLYLIRIGGADTSFTNPCQSILSLPARGELCLKM
jgi:hypothetical protein